MAISLGVLCAFARDSVTRAATRERQKRVSRQGAKLAKAKLTEDRPNRGKVCGIIGLAPKIGVMHSRKTFLGLVGRLPDATDWYPSYQ